MARTIDADVLKKAILAEPWKNEPNAVRLTVDYINIIIDEQPTVDAVEVVRCKDCKFLHDKVYCTLVTGMTRIEPGDYCSRGERRTNETY